MFITKIYFNILYNYFILFILKVFLFYFMYINKKIEMINIILFY